MKALGFGLDRFDELVPAKSRWALWFPETSELWHARPLERTAGGFPFAAMSLDPTQAAIWEAINGSRTVAAVAERVGISVDRLLRATARWTAMDVQALQLRERPVRAREPGLERLVAPERPVHSREEHHYGDGGETTLDRYHGEQITDGATHFDDRETTLAHAFAVEHPALGQPFGAALARFVARRWDGAGPVLEIGGGTGELMAAFRSVFPDVEVWRLDLSPELLATQEAANPGTRSVLGSATEIPLPDRSVGLVICNEVIADLKASPTPEGWSVPSAPGQQRYNVGAWMMLAEVARVLRTGGACWVSEFGALDELPVETSQLDHPEVSIHFGQLLEVARQVGLDAQVRGVADWLEMDRTAKWLSRPSYEALRARFAAGGGHLRARAWTPRTLELPWKVEGLSWVPITEDGAAPVVDRVLALVAVAG